MSTVARSERELDRRPTRRESEMTAIDVLVADDDEGSLRGVVRAVTALGYLCRGVRDGQEALEEQEREPAAIVLTDWNMPRLDGLKLCQALRRQAVPPYVIVMTADNGGTRLLDAIRGGADEFIRKPIDLDELEVRLLAAARLVRTQRKLAALNRLRLDEDLTRALTEARRYGRRYSLAICDVDNFKGYNDRNGHLAGDAVLQRIAAALRDGLRAGDAVYRYGGDEFLVLFPEQSAAEGARAMDRVRSLVEALAIARSSDRPDDVVTISAGVAELGDEGRDAWIGRADDALYLAKADGRNCVRVAHVSQPSKVASGG
jgi:two-component system chemotaxis response regulator CheY